MGERVFNPVFPDFSSLASAREVIQFPRHSAGEKPINLLVTNLVLLQRKTAGFLALRTAGGRD